MTSEVRGRTWIADEAQIQRWGERIGREIETPVVLDLRGDLGAGKTTLARSIARGAGVEGSIPSPTYNLVFRYLPDRDRQVVHLDLYRIEDPDEVWELGWEEMPAAADIMLMEWGQRAEALLPPDRWLITLVEADGGDRRRVEVTRIGSPPPLPEAAS